MSGPRTAEGRARALANLRPLKMNSERARQVRAMRKTPIPKGAEWWSSPARAAAFRRMRKKWTPGCQIRGRHKVPEHVHPFVREFFLRVNEQKATLREVAARAGLDAKMFQGWRKKASPRLTSVEAALNALGLRLVIVDDDGKRL